jgi:hypothetical protein
MAVVSARLRPAETGASVTTFSSRAVARPAALDFVTATSATGAAPERFARSTVKAMKASVYTAMAEYTAMSEKVTRVWVTVSA